MIYLKKKVKTEKVMIIIKQSIVIVNMNIPQSASWRRVYKSVPGSIVYVNVKAISG